MRKCCSKCTNIHESSAYPIISTAKELKTFCLEHYFLKKTVMNFSHPKTELKKLSELESENIPSYFSSSAIVEKITSRFICNHNFART